MNFDDLFSEPKPQEPIKMEYTEFVNKTITVLKFIESSHQNAHGPRRLLETEYPSEEICEACTGCGTFTDFRSETSECIRDSEAGECFQPYVNYEEIGVDVDSIISDIYELLSVDEIIFVSGIDID